jgi:hypothetical protein
MPFSAVIPHAICAAIAAATIKCILFAMTFLLRASIANPDAPRVGLENFC